MVGWSLFVFVGMWFMCCDGIVCFCVFVLLLLIVVMWVWIFYVNFM